MHIFDQQLFSLEILSSRSISNILSSVVSITYCVSDVKRHQIEVIQSREYSHVSKIFSVIFSACLNIIKEF